MSHHHISLDYIHFTIFQKVLYVNIVIFIFLQTNINSRMEVFEYDVFMIKWSFVTYQMHFMIKNTIFINFCRTWVLFVGPLIPLFGQFVTSALGFKAWVDFWLAPFLAFMLFLRFTSGATPADCIEVSMSASHLLYKLCM